MPRDCTGLLVALCKSIDGGAGWDGKNRVTPGAENQPRRPVGRTASGFDRAWKTNRHIDADQRLKRQMGANLRECFEDSDDCARPISRRM